jgi:colanic acid biosynthesis glycosyl transferase WcaI
MKIMFMSQFYAPEEISTSVIATELAVDLAKKGHEVTMVTGAPNYPYGRILAGYKNSVYKVEILSGVKVVRTWSYINPSKSFFSRTLHFVSYSISAFYGGLFSGRPDVIVCYSPPLTLCLAAWLLSLIWGVPWIMQIEDLYPDAAVAVGVLTNKKVIAFFEWMERFLYRSSKRLSVLSEGFRKNLLGKRVPDEKITIIPVWADPDIICPMEKENSFRARIGVQGKFVVLYAGNMGFTSCLEDLMAAAEMLKDQEDIAFVMIGEGVKKESFEQIVREKGLKNVMILPYQPRKDYPEVLAAADVNVVTINAGSAQSSLPSKVFNAMASARPILVVSPLNGDLAQVVHEGNCGMIVPPEAPNRLAQAILEMKCQGEYLMQMGQNGRKLLETSYSRKGCVEQFEVMFREVASGDKSVSKQPAGVENKPLKSL